MTGSIWMRRIETLAITTALAVSSLLIPTAYAHADLYNYTYISSSYNANIIGTFEANPTGILSFTSAGKFVNFTGMGTLGTGNVIVNSGDGNTLFYTAGVLLNTVNVNTGAPASVNAAGVINGDSSSFSFGSGSFGLFIANLASSSGGVPSPEVNAGLGMLLAGATFAFLRRKRSARQDATAA